MNHQIVDAAHHVARALNQRQPLSLVPLLPSYLKGDCLTLAEFTWTAVRAMTMNRRLIGGQSTLENNVLGALCIFSVWLSRCTINSEEELQQAFVTALMLSNKIFEDVWINTAVWAAWSGISLEVLTQFEIKWLQDLDWRVSSMTQGENHRAWASVLTRYLIALPGVLTPPKVDGETTHMNRSMVSKDVNQGKPPMT
ncbi:MAG: hypothetical protein M1816_004997 [Peltula sp. TS41687]|nr:MAG: hypothetical protein M1816_004997 [Peltula sp. TS41687]